MHRFIKRRGARPLLKRLRTCAHRMSSTELSAWKCPFNASTLVAAPHTPFKEDGSGVAIDVIAPFATWLKREGFNTVFVCGTNGESYACSSEERRAVLEAWMNTPEAKSKELRVIAHISCQAMPETEELAQHAASLEVDAIAYMVPTFFKPSSDALSAQMLAHVAQQVPHDTPVLLYHFPAMTGVESNVTNVLQLANTQAPNVVGCKFTHNDLEDLASAAQAGFSMMIGPGDDLLLPAIRAGGHGGFSVSGMLGGSFAMRQFAEAVKSGNEERAAVWQEQLAAQMKLIADQPNGFIAAGKALIRDASGLSFGPPRLPLMPLESAGKDKLLREMAGMVAKQTDLLSK